MSEFAQPESNIAAICGGLVREYQSASRMAELFRGVVEFAQEVETFAAKK